MTGAEGHGTQCHAMRPDTHSHTSGHRPVVGPRGQLDRRDTDRLAGMLSLSAAAPRQEEVCPGGCHFLFSVVVYNINARKVSRLGMTILTILVIFYLYYVFLFGFTLLIYITNIYGPVL